LPSVNFKNAAKSTAKTEVISIRKQISKHVNGANFFLPFVEQKEYVRRYRGFFTGN